MKVELAPDRRYLVQWEHITELDKVHDYIVALQLDAHRRQAAGVKLPEHPGFPLHRSGLDYEMITVCTVKKIIGATPGAGVANYQDVASGHSICSAADAYRIPYDRISGTFEWRNGKSVLVLDQPDKEKKPSTVLRYTGRKQALAKALVGGAIFTESERARFWEQFHILWPPPFSNDLVTHLKRQIAILEEDNARLRATYESETT